MNTLALFPEPREGAGVRDNWATPRELFTELDAALGPFVLDACALPHNAKCRRFYTPTDDGLVQPWADDGVTWCNPPFSRLERWVAKAWRESLHGRRSVVLMPANRTEQAFFHRYVVPYAAIHFLRGRTQFEAPPGVSHTAAGSPFGCLLALYGFHGSSGAAPGAGGG